MTPKNPDHTSNAKPTAIIAIEAAPRTTPSNYPEPFASRMNGRLKRPLGEVFGLQNFGVNLTELGPHSESSLLHKHSRQEEFIYVLTGNPILVLEDKEIPLSPGMCAGFTATTSAHKIVNRSAEKVTYLEVGDRSRGDEVTYPGDDLKAILQPNGKWAFLHKSGEPY